MLFSTLALKTIQQEESVILSPACTAIHRCLYISYTIFFTVSNHQICNIRVLSAVVELSASNELPLMRARAIDSSGFSLLLDKPLKCWRQMWYHTNETMKYDHSAWLEPVISQWANLISHFFLLVRINHRYWHIMLLRIWSITEFYFTLKRSWTTP